MSNKKIIQEAKADFEAIKKYASEEAKKQLDKKIEEKLKALQESISVEADGASIIIDDSKIEVSKDDSTVTVNKEDGIDALPAVEIPDTDTMDATDFDTTDSDETSEDEPEEIEELFEIRSINEEDENTVAQNPFQPVIDKLDIIINKLGATEGGTGEENGEVAIIDDEPNGDMDASNPDLQPDAMPTTPAPQSEAQPTINEFNLEEYENMNDNNEEAMVKEIMDALAESGYEIEEDGDDETIDSDDDLEIDGDEDDTLDFDSDDDSDELDADDMTSDDSKEITITINGDDCECVIADTDEDDELSFDIADDDDLEVGDDEETDELDETRGIGLGVKHLSANRNRDSKNIEENTKIKAQYESMLDELKQENNSLKSDIKEFEDSFVELRNSIDEMQTFNAKLALANKLFLNGGLSVSDKISINESLDKARTVKEAQKIYEKLREGKTVVSESKKTGSLKSNTTKIATGSQPLYESNEARTLKNEVSRSQVLAGIKKSEE